MTTRAKASVGEWRGLFAPRGVGGGHALSRGSAAGRGGRRRAATPDPRRPVVARRHASLRHRGKPISAGPVQRCRRLFRRERPPSRALPPVASSRRKTAPPRLRPPTATHWHLSGWTGGCRGRAGRADQAAVDHATPLNLTFQSHRARPGTSEDEPDPSIEGQFRGRACSPPAMIHQAPLQIACPSQVMPHLALVRPLEMQQVHGTHILHKPMITQIMTAIKFEKPPSKASCIASLKP